VSNGKLLGAEGQPGHRKITTASTRGGRVAKAGATIPAEIAKLLREGKKGGRGIRTKGLSTAKKDGLEGKDREGRHEGGKPLRPGETLY